MVMSSKILKRYLVLAGLLSFFLVPKAHAAVQLVQSSTQSVDGTSSTCALAPTTAGNFLLMMYRINFQGISGITFSDTKGDSFIKSATSSNAYVGMAYAYNIAGGSTAATMSGFASNIITLSCYEFSGVLSTADPLDTGTRGTYSATTTYATPSMTTASSSDLLIGMITADTASITPYSPFSQLSSLPYATHGWVTYVTNALLQPAGTYTNNGLLPSSNSGNANVAAFKPGLVGIAQDVSKFVSSTNIATVTTTISTTQANELIVIFLSNNQVNPTTKGVSGGGLTWTEAVSSTATSRGYTGIWAAWASSTLSNVVVSSTISGGGSYTNGAMYVASFIGATSTLGASGKFVSAGSQATTSVSLTTTKNNSWVWGVAELWSNSATPTATSGQSVVGQWLGTPNGSAHWMQKMNSPTPASGTTVALWDSLSVSQTSNYIAIEILPASASGGGSAGPDATSASTTVSGDGARSGDTITVSGSGFGTVSAGSRATCNGGAGTGCIQFVAGGTATVADGSISSWTDTAITFTVSSTLATNGGVNALQVWAANASDTTPLTFYIYPNITALASVGTNAAREYNAADTDGLIMLSGDHFGTTTSTATILGSAASLHYSAQGSCSVSGYTSSTACFEVPTAIANNTYTGTVTLTRGSDSKQATTSLSILPRVTAVTPTSSAVGNIIQFLGDHLCEGGTCPVSPNRASATFNVAFGSTTSSDSDFVNQTGGAGACNGTGAAWTDSEICVNVPATAPLGAATTTVASNGNVSNGQAFTVVAGLSAPGAPTYTNVTSTALTASWTSVSGATYYKIERAVAGQSFSQIGTTTLLSYNDSGLSSGAAYWYRVRGYGASGNGAYSATSSIAMPGSTSPALVTHGTSLNSNVSPALNTTGANLIVVGCHYWTTLSNAVSSSPANTWYPLTSYGTSGSSGFVQFFYAYNATTSASQTFSCLPQQYEDITVSAYSGILSSGSPLDGQNGNTVSATTIQTGSVTPTQLNELLVAGYSDGYSSNATATISNGFTVTDSPHDGSNMSGAMAYLIATTTSAYNPTWYVQTSTSMNRAATIAMFRAAAAGLNPPNAPSLDAPVSAGQDLSTTPVFKMTAIDPYGYSLQYKVSIYTVPGCSGGLVQSNDQSASQTGWSGQNASSSKEYTSGTQGTFTVQTPLSANTTYYWKASAKDPEGSNTWTDSTSCNSFVTTYGNWTTDSGNWSISGNQLVVAPASGSFAELHMTGSSQANAILEFKVKSSAVGAGTGNAAVIARLQAGGDHYRAGVLDFLNQNFIAGKSVSGAYSTIATTPYTLSAGTFYGVRALVSGAGPTTLGAWLNGGNALSGSDSAATLQAAGSFGIAASSTNGSATFTFDDFAAYSSTVVTLNNLPVGGSWSVRDHTGAVIACQTGSTWDLSTYSGQVPIDYDNGGGSVAMWTGNATCSGAPSYTYPSSGLATDIFGGDQYAYSNGSGGGNYGGAISATSSVTISTVGSVSY